MDIASYTCNRRNEVGDVKMEKPHQELLQGPTAMAMEGLDAAVAAGGRFEYWTAPKSARSNMELCNYGDTLDQMLQLPKTSTSLIHGSWRNLTSASRTSSGTKPNFSGVFGGRPLGQVVRATIQGEKESYHSRILKVGGDGEELANGIAGRQGYEIK